MVWTTFAALTSATGAELDGNFGILSNLVPINCSVSGTNSLALTILNAAASITAYQQGQQFTGIAAATNTGATTANVGALGALNVYVDTGSGPQALAGSEIVQNCAFTLTYDSALNSGAGGFHLSTGAGELKNQTITVNSLIVSGPASVGTLSVNAGPSVLGLPSAQYTVSFGSLTPNSSESVTINLGSVGTVGTIFNVHPGDLAFLTLGGATQTAGILLAPPTIPAAGSVVVTAFNVTSNTTVTPVTAPYRLTIMRYS